MNNILFKTPSSSEEFKKYDLFRWKILRKPIGKSIESLKDEYEDSSYHLIGVIDNKIIACGRLHFNNAYEAQIRYMAIDEHFQRKGIGVKVIELLEAEAKKKQINKIILNARNHVIEFYKKSGYMAVRKYEGSDTGIPHTTMEKIL
jgi:N-acetylglutamate synthase-like GNAT family acetyltransferase